jgi:4-aminobutyrate aminotransferase/(S)-3-amino-2-methylpropionate transaminase
MARGWGSVFPFYVDRAVNAELWDVEGKRYIDFGAGIAVVNTGHVHPKIVSAASAQLERYNHTCFMVAPYEPAVELAERLNALVPGDSPKKTLLLNSGAEAVENAVKIARRHTGRPAIIAFAGGFHGRTMMALALTGKTSPYKQGFGPLPGPVYHAPYPYTYRGGTVDASLDAIERIFTEDVEPEAVAAIVLEPVLGEGGFVPAPPELLRRLRELCDQHGIVLVVDEIQTGFARTGRLFATEYAGIEPDLMTLAKGIAGGFPLSAVVGKADVMDAVHPGGIGGTYGGNPISCAAALAALDVIEEEGLAERSLSIGSRMSGRLTQTAAEVPTIGDVRGLGAMVGIELVTDAETREPATDLTKAVIAACAEKGLVVLSCGTLGNVIRLLPPLTASDDLIDEGLDILVEALRETSQRLAGKGRGL